MSKKQKHRKRKNRSRTDRDHKYAESDQRSHDADANEPTTAISETNSVAERTTNRRALDDDDQKKAKRFRGLGFSQIGSESYFFLLICVAAQIITVLITWPIWEVRDDFVNIPWVAGTPQFACGYLMIFSLACVLVSPRIWGIGFHLSVLFIAISMDQLRCQPQVLSITVLMIACVWSSTRQLCAWYLVSMWFWAGLHKLLSDEWFGANSAHLLNSLKLVHPHDFYWSFALIVALSEFAQGMLAWFLPRVAAITCAALHIGIAIFILAINWNFSVLPWNVCTAIVGAWLFLKVSDGNKRLEFPKPRWQFALAIATLIIPIGFYFGIVRHSFAHVLYSGNLPAALITRTDGSAEKLNGWEEFSVPFPREPKAFLDMFQLSGEPGEKLHIREPRQFLSSGFYLLNSERRAELISEQDFYSEVVGTQRGIGVDDSQCILQLEIAGVALKKRSAKEMIFAVEFPKESFSPELLDELLGLPNIEQLQFRGCSIQDSDLVKLSGLSKLSGIGLDETPVTENGLKILSQNHSLGLIQYGGEVYANVEAILNRQK